MWFRNLQVFRLPPNSPIQADKLNEQLSAEAFAPALSAEEISVGWVPPLAEVDKLVYPLGGHLLMNLRQEKKLLPARVISQVVRQRADLMEEREGFKPGRKQMKELKEQVRDELLPLAFSLSSDVRVWIDPKGGWLVVDSGSINKAADVFGLLARAVEGFPGKALRPARSVAVSLTEWLANGEAPAGMTVDQDAELKGRDGKAQIRYANESMAPEDVARHIKEGKQCARLALTWRDRVSFVLTDKLELKRVQPLDVLNESLNASKGEDAIGRFESDMTLMTSELALLLDDLLDALGGEAIAQSLTGTRIVTSSSAADGCKATVASNCALVAPILSATPASCTISAASGPQTWTPNTRSLSRSTIIFIIMRSGLSHNTLVMGRKVERKILMCL